MLLLLTKQTFAAASATEEAPKRSYSDRTFAGALVLLDFVRLDSDRIKAKKTTRRSMREKVDRHIKKRRKDRIKFATTKLPGKRRYPPGPRGKQYCSTTLDKFSEKNVFKDQLFLPTNQEVSEGTFIKVVYIGFKPGSRDRRVHQTWGGLCDILQLRITSTLANGEMIDWSSSESSLTKKFIRIKQQHTPCNLLVQWKRKDVSAEAWSPWKEITIEVKDPDAPSM